MADSNVIYPLPLRSIPATSTGATYVPIGEPFEQDVGSFNVVNGSDGDYFISFDGINDHDLNFHNSGGGPGNVSIFLSPLKPGQKVAFQQGQSISVRQNGAPPTGGTIYLVAYGLKQLS